MLVMNGIYYYFKSRSQSQCHSLVDQKSTAFEDTVHQKPKRNITLRSALPLQYYFAIVSVVLL